MLLDELRYDLKGWTNREKILLQMLINELRVPLRTDGVKGPDKHGELFREHPTIRRVLKPHLRYLDSHYPPGVPAIARREEEERERKREEG